MKTPTLVITFTVILLIVVGAFADVPNRINYQGTLTDSAGNPIDGTRWMRFYIFEDSTGGVEIWSEQHESVTINDGLFRVTLGSNYPLPSDLFDGNIRWLTVRIYPDGSALSPRQPLVTVPYSFKTSKADSSDYAEESGHAVISDTAFYSYSAVVDADWIISGDDMYSNVSGNIGIGTGTPSEKLHIYENTNAITGIKIENPNTGSNSRERIVFSDEYGDQANITLYDNDAIIPNAMIISNNRTDGLMSFFTNGGERVRIKSSGDVGIGTSNPQNKLDVEGAMAVGASYSGANTAPDNGMIIQGNVGIGTTSPTENLHVNGNVQVNTGFNLKLGEHTRIYGESDGLYLGADYGLYLSPDHNIIISPSGYTDFLDSSGAGFVRFKPGSRRVGINTQSPDCPLHVETCLVYDSTQAIHGEIPALGSHCYVYGVKGETWSRDSTSAGVMGCASHPLGNAMGVYARSDCEDGIGIYADAYHLTGENCAIYARTHSPNGYAGYFFGPKNYFGGKVGIGTEIPDAKLDVYSTTSDMSLEVKNTSLLSIGRLVNFERVGEVTISGNDMLQIRVTYNSVDDMSFIECERGSDIEFKVQADGDVYADGSFTGPADFAEMIAVSNGANTVSAGDVLVIDPNNLRATIKSTQPRSTLVAGIYSTNPGFVGSERDWDKPNAGDDNEADTYTREEIATLFNEIPMAVMGIVSCKVSAENGAINPGDLLVTSSTPGHAMRDDNPQVGTVVGKALEPLYSGTGVIKTLVTLH